MKRRITILAMATLAIAASIVIALPFVRSAIARSVEARCRRTTEATCTAGRVELAADGLLVRDLRLDNARLGLSARIGIASVKWSWWSAAFRRPQDVSAVISDVNVTGRMPLAETLRELAAFQSRRRAARAGGGTLRLVEARAESVGITMAAEGDRSPVAAHGVALEWSRDSHALRVEWRDAQASVGDALEAHTGSCSLRRDSDELSITCSSPRIDMDAARVGDVVDALHPVVDAARALRDAVTPARSTETAAGTEHTPTTSLIARRGSVRIRRRETIIADLSPAELNVTAVGTDVRSASLRVGRNGDGDARSNPDLEFVYERPERGAWRADVSASDLPLEEIARWTPAVPWHAVDRGRVRMRFHAEPAPGAPGALVVSGTLGAESFGLYHQALAHDPIDDLDVALEGDARIDIRRRRIETEGLRANVNGVVVAVAGWFERPAAHEIALDASLRIPVTDCDALRRSLPPAATGAVHDLTFSGTIGADAHIALDTRDLPLTELQVDVDDRCQVVRDEMQSNIRRLRGVFVQRVTEPTGIRAFVTGPGSAAWVPLARISPYMMRALLVREDGAFYRHHGFNTNEVRAAIVRNVAARRFVYGASTISMQLAKNIFLQREKTLVRKLQEVVLTWYLERSLDKDSILELYLNVVEFGPGIYGIGPASRFFFGREPGNLTPMQAAYLATLLPNPIARFANYQRGTISAGMSSALRAVVRRMASAGYLSHDESQFGESETLVFRPESVPVRGALTQTVDPTTTDEQAQQLSPPPTELSEPLEPHDESGSDEVPVE